MLLSILKPDESFKGRSSHSVVYSKIRNQANTSPSLDFPLENTIKVLQFFFMWTQLWKMMKMTRMRILIQSQIPSNFVTNWELGQLPIKLDTLPLIHFSVSLKAIFPKTACRKMLELFRQSHWWAILALWTKILTSTLSRYEVIPAVLSISVNIDGLPTFKSST